MTDRPRLFRPRPPDPSQDDLARLRLLRSRRVGPATFARLLAEHGSAAEALTALPGIARAAGLDDYAPCPEGVALAEARAAGRLGARPLWKGGALYPPALAEIEDAPPLLWALGDAALLSRPLVAVAGARNASALGLRFVRRLAGELSEAGFVVVSGLARGIDAAAHEAALPGGTIAVQAGGVDVIYPAENADLAQRIAASGLRLSDMPMGMPPRARHFPARNRIISGLSRAVVIVEAAAKSGSLITARCAAEQGREVLAVPGHPFDARSAGANMLLRDGATLVRSAADVIEALGGAQPALPLPPVRRAEAIRLDAPPLAPRANATAAPSPFPLAAEAALHGAILDRLGAAPVMEDHLLEALAQPLDRIAPILAEMELSGEILRQPGGMLCRGTG